MFCLRFQVSHHHCCVVVMSLVWMMVFPSMTIINSIPDASAILKKRSCIPGHYPSTLERQEVMAKIYIDRSSAASGELRWWEGSRPGRSKDFLNHQLINWVLASKDKNRESGKGARWDLFLNLLSHGDLPSA